MQLGDASQKRAHFMTAKSMHKPATTQSVPLDECGAKEKVRLRVVSRGLLSAAIARLYNVLRFWPLPAQAVHTGYP